MVVISTDEDENIVNILNPSMANDDIADLTLRPKDLDEFVGQRYLKENLNVFIKSAKKRNVPLEHVLLTGPPGLGKTTIANIIANEMDGDITSITGPSIKKAGEMVSLLISLKKGGIFFIDEVHGLSKVLEEVLYPAMEDFKLTLTKESKTRESEVVKVRLKRFTLVGATTRPGVLTAPFRDRFGIILRFELYETKDILEILRRSSSILKIPATHDGLWTIAQRSRGTPRIANRLLRRVWDFATVNDEKEITKQNADKAFLSLRIDKIGLDDLDRKIILNMVEHYNCGPVGVKTIAMSVGEEIKTIEEVHEPYLVHIGFLKRTPAGREVTMTAIEHLEKTSGIFGTKFKRVDKKIGNVYKAVGNMPLIDPRDIK